MPNSRAEQLGATIRQLRYRKGLTQARLAERAGVGEKTLKRLELGKTDTPHPDTLSAVAGALGLSSEALFEAAGTVEPRPSPMPALHQLPRPPSNFSGRTHELEGLTGRASSGTSPVVVIHGMGGIGKSALALAVAERLSGHFPEGQFYLDLCGTTEPMPATDAMLHVVRSIEPQRRLPQTEREIEAAYRTVLRGNRCLLLLDNAEDRRQVEPLIPPDGSVLLVTSRQRFSLPGAHVCALTPLGGEAAEALILSHAPHARSVLGDLTRACGGLPLALTLVGRTLSERPDLDPAEYAGRLADDQGRLSQLDAGEDGFGVEASFSLSFGTLEREDQDGMCALSIFPQPFDRPAAARVWGLDERMADARIGRLLRLNLLESTGTGSEARYRLHDLVRVFADGRLSANTRITAQRRHAQHYIALLSEAERTARQPAGEDGVDLIASLNLFDREWGHIQAAFSHASAADDAEAAQLCITAARAFTLLRLRFTPEQRLRWHRAAIARIDSEASSEDLALHLVACARAHQELGETTEAIAHGQRALATAQAPGGAEAAAWVALGDAYHALGAPREAIEHGERGLARAVELGERFEQTIALIVLGWGYRVQGAPRRAAAYSKRALTMARELGDRELEASALLALGFAHLSQGRRDRGSGLEALELARELGNRRMEGYAILMLLAGDVDGERPEDCLTIAREIGDRRMEGHALLSSGTSQLREGQAERAVTALETALDIAHETGDRSMQSMGLLALGTTLMALKDSRRAMELLERAESLALEMGSHASAAVAAWFASHALEQYGDLQGAIAAAERAGSHGATSEEPPGEADVPGRVRALRARLG